ncbi:hypothetical protein [Saccharothrix deserti]|uniref:hypothetical protein n=1 Tax=Saccharothrix deserti TaxID=2593674 RepID=UPI00192E48AB|nr:hypothetical protein [Saccharothrix deserti]
MVTVMASRSEDPDLLGAWLRTKGSTARRKSSNDPFVHRGLRFAFYGRMSTSEYQDRRTSRLWQRGVAERLVAGHGVIVAEYFETGCTRLKEWADRPQAARLLAALADPDRGFDAIVVGSTSAVSAATSSCAWPRCSNGTVSRCGCPRPADAST